MTTEDIDSILTSFMNSACDYEAGLKVDLDAEFEQAKAKLEAHQKRMVIAELENLLEIPTKYIDDNTMVYWSDFNAETLEKIIREKIAELKGEKDEH